MQSDSETPVLEETYRELRLPLLRLAFLLTGSRETAEDLVQSAFAAAQPRWPHVADPPASCDGASSTSPRTASAGSSGAVGCSVPTIPSR